MAAKKSSVNKVFIYFSLVLVFSVIAAVNTSTQPGVTFANEGETAKANKEAEPNESEKEKAPCPDHSHRAFSERVQERAKMVARQIKARGVDDPNVLASLRTVPRHVFVRHDDLRRAYRDHPMPIGKGQTISQPYIVGYMTDALGLKAESKVLEIGTGSGYQAAVAAEIAREVYTIEIIKELAETAKERLKELGYRNVFAKAGDGYYGWEEKGPFDAIIITAAAGLVPPPLKEQLKPGGRMILPLGSPYGAQTLVLVTKDEKGKIRSRSLLPVRFVPMTGQVQQAKESGKK
jgi:protein-L-isoaspartate(D-aspartate) O-methyltransferase